LAEIKSTLDLVMEKTQNLTLSAEEKQIQRDKDTANRIKGLVQKLQDGLLTADQLTMEYERFRRDSELSDDRLLVREVLTRLDPAGDNQILLEILEKCCRFDTAAIRADITGYREAYHQAARERSAQLKENLEQNHFITGSAVLPNIDADEQWRQTAQEMRRQFEAQLH
jgi:hypothetical protein